MKKPSTKGLTALFLLFFSTNIFAQTFVGVSSVPADNSAQAGPTPPAITPPSGMQAGDLVIIYGEYRATGATITMNVTGGQTWTSTTANSGSNLTTEILWCTYNGTWAANPSIKVGAGLTNALTAVMYVFSPSHANTTWNVNQGPNNTSTAAANPNSITGVTTTAPNTVTMAFWGSAIGNTWGSLSGTNWSNTSIGSQYRNTSGSIQSTAAAYNIQGSAGATNIVSENEVTGTITAARTTIISWAESPVNDNCLDALSITSATSCVGGTSSLTGQTLNGSTVEGTGIATTCGGSTTSQDVWYQFVAQSTYPTVTISNLGGSWAAKLRIQMLSGPCGAMTQVGCANNAPLIPTTPLVIGTTYYIRVLKSDATAPTGGSATWAFDICVTDPTPQTYSAVSNMKEVFSQTIVSAPNVLNTAWEVTYGPDGYLWVTEAKGYKAYRIDPNTGARTTILDISQGASGYLSPTEHTRYNVQFLSTQSPWPQGGFAGLVLHPHFSDTPYVFISYVHKYDSASVTTNGGYYFKNNIVRFKYNFGTGKLELPVTICDTLPGSSDHNSQRMIIAPVGGKYYLFYGQGDMGAGQLSNQWRPNHAQDTSSYQGKILRFNLDPDTDIDSTDMWIPNNNPYCHTIQSAVWAIGVRNNQGFAYDSTNDVLYGSSHGPYSDDEINIIQRYKNYGHPLVEGYAADGNYNGNKNPGTSTSFSAGVPFSTSSGVSTVPPIGNEQFNADSITAAGYAPYKDPLFSGYPGPTSGTNSVANIWATTTGANANWPSEAWSGIDVYQNTLIPGWKHSLVICGLKWGRVLRLKLGSGGTAIVPTNGVDTAIYFQSKNRYRDLAFNPNGKEIYVSMEGSTSSGPAAGAATVPTCTNCIVKYTFLGYADASGESTIPAEIPVTDTTTGVPLNTVDSATTVTIDDTNNNYWVPITGPDGNILAEIYANGNNLGIVRSAFYRHKGPIRIKGGIRYLDRNMTITPQFQPSSPVKIRLYMTTAEFDSLNADPLSGLVGGINGLKILKNSDPCGAAIASSTLLVTPTFKEVHGTTGYMLQGDISSFSSFFFASSNILLPLDLVSFKGSLQKNNTLLQWETTNEVNTSEFIIERSIDGQNFEQIGTTPAKGSTKKNDYSFTDYEASHQSVQTLYYRLKMIDQNGGFTYSEVVTITLPLSAITTVSVFPNPATRNVTVSISAPGDGKVKWSLVDNAGRVVNHNVIELKQGTNSLSINLTRLSTGFYYLNVTGSGINQKVKIEKL